MASLVLVGLNHRTAPVEVRERLSVPDSKLPGFVRSLRTLPNVDGAALLSTCNRVEAVVSASNEDVIESIVNWLSACAEADRATLESHLYILRYADVVKHLFRVASGLDSMILGEPQIGGQMRNAFRVAGENEALDPLLTQLFNNTMRVAKKIRTETGIGEHAVSIPFAAVELARKIFGDLRGLRVLLLGAGEMAELTAEHLHEHEVKQVFVANRSHARAVELALRFEGEAVQFESIDERLAGCDIVIASTGAPHYLIDAPQIRRALETRRNRALFLVDLSVPRNIDPAIAKVEGAYLYNIDDLQNVADANLELRQRKAADAEEIISREVEVFRRRIVAQDAVPTIVELQQRLEKIRVAEVEKCLRKLGPVTAEQRQAIEMLTTQMINKILHYPILKLKDVSDEPQERESLRQTIRKIFGL